MYIEANWALNRANNTSEFAYFVLLLKSVLGAKEACMA